MRNPNGCDARYAVYALASSHDPMDGDSHFSLGVDGFVLLHGLEAHELVELPSMRSRATEVLRS